MMNRFLMAASALALIAACTGAADAEADARQGVHHRGAGMLFMSDANNDGTVTRQEFEAGRDTLFARLDANSDGNVTREERRGAMRAVWRERREEHGEQRFHRRDANNDSAISREEFLAGPSEMFARLDANNDGQLSADERPQRHERRGAGGGRHRGGLLGADANNDGVMSRAEFAAGGADLFQRLDTNSDGQVTRAEAEAARPQRPTQN